MRKKGLLRKKEYRGSQDLDLEYHEQWPRLENKDIRRLTKEMKGYLRRLRHLSIKFDLDGEPSVSLEPLLKSIKRNFASLVSLKVSLRTTFTLLKETLNINKLFRRLRPTLKHLYLDFARTKNFVINFPLILGQIILRNLHRLETLCLNFGGIKFPLSAVMFFINTVCSRLPHLRELKLLMVNCFVDDKWYLPQTSIKNNLRSLILNLDCCWNLSIAYLSFLQHDIATACPFLEQLYIRVPNYERFSHSFLSSIEEKLLQRLNLKILFLERSLEKTWDRYQSMQIEEIQEKKMMEELLREYRPKGLREEELGLFCEILEEDQLYFEESSDIGEQDYLLGELEEERLENERNGIEEQDEAERILRGELTNKELTEINIMHEMEPYLEYNEQFHLLGELEREQEEKERNEIEEQDEAERI